MQNQKICSKLVKELQLNDNFYSIKFIETTGKNFAAEYVPSCDVVIFTGGENNKNEVIKQMKKGALLIFNGRGHNPIIVTESADLDKAVQDSIYTKFFNSGQDCAGPDMIFVHQSIFKIFFEKFFNSIRALKVCEYPDCDIGPILRSHELKRLTNILVNKKDEIVFGGNVNCRLSIVEPTIIKLENGYNFDEMFGPVAFIKSYESEQDLDVYFQHPRYLSHKMYVTVYGESDHLFGKNDENLPNKDCIGIVLNETIYEAEKGFLPYGGYSKGA